MALFTELTKSIEAQQQESGFFKNIGTKIFDNL